jgi:hypothetical protein
MGPTRNTPSFIAICRVTVNQRPLLVMGNIASFFGDELDAYGQSQSPFIGASTVIADFTMPGANSQVAARLLDVAPDGTETLVARALWRPDASSTPVRRVFQLHPNGWRFEPGHVAKLELLPNDAPYGRASNGQQDVTVSNLELRLPVRERPGVGDGFVGAPAPKVVPSGYELAAEFQGFGEKASAFSQRKLKVLGRRLSLGVKCPGKWRSCDDGAVKVKGAAEHARFTIAKGSFELDGGSAERLKLKLTARARRYFKRHGSLRSKSTVDTVEQASPTTSTRKVIVP